MKGTTPETGLANESNGPIDGAAPVIVKGTTPETGLANESNGIAPYATPPEKIAILKIKRK